MKLTHDVDGQLFAAALHQITHIWGRDMDELQRASLASQIVREIERRGIVSGIEATEREACARIASGMSGTDDCDFRGVMDPETGEVPCNLERRGEVCTCAERLDVAFKIADKIRARKQEG